MTRTTYQRPVHVGFVCLAGALFFHGITDTAIASKVQSWKIQTEADFQKGKFDNVVLTEQGTLRLSREIKPWSDLQAEYIWDMGLDKDGNLFVATGPEGKVFRVTPEGASSEFFKTDSPHIFALVVADNGAVYIGTAPTGQIIKIDTNGKSAVHFETGKKYIWDMCLDNDGNLLAATGNEAEIFRIAPDGTGKSLFKCKQDHILSLAVGPKGDVYAGSDGDGLIYRISDSGRGFVIYDSTESEVKSLLVSKDGSVFAGTSSPSRIASGLFSGRSSRLNSSSSSSPLSGSRSNSENPKTPVQTGTTNSNLAGSSTRPSTRTSPLRSLSGTNSVYKININGNVRKLFQERVLILSFAEVNGRLMIGTGQTGQLFELPSDPQDRSEVGRLDHGEILAMVQRDDGTLLLATGDPGRIYTLTPGHAATGSYKSDVFDADRISQWGSVRWASDTPAGTSVSVSSRSGNVSEPDDTWSDWSAPQHDPMTAQAGAPAARFVQFKLTLKSTQSTRTPVVHSINMRYMTNNEAPEISKLEVPNQEDGDGKSTSNKLKIKWTAKDPNKDDLLYSLYFKKEEWSQWVRLAQDLTRSEYEWDTVAVPEGHYRVKIKAIDSKDNPTGKELESNRSSTRFVIDHRAPELSLKRHAADHSFEVRAIDDYTPIVKASYSIDSGKWIDLFPIDNLFDSGHETFRFPPMGLKPGTHVIVVRATDAAGNVSAADLVFQQE